MPLGRMPISRIIHPTGLTGQPVQVPDLPSGIPGIITGTGVQGGPAGISGLAPAQPAQAPSYGMIMPFYAGFVPEVAKANNINPSNQGQRALRDSSKWSFMAMPRNSPSRSQFSQGYTQPLQVFAASNTWQLAGPSDVNNGVRPKQPNQKYVSPFSTLPIPTRMPWDL